MRNARLLAAGGVVSLLGGSASADYLTATQNQVLAKSGVPIRIGYFFSCRSHFPYQGTAFVRHGKVTFQDVTLNQCGNPKEPARLIYYVSDPGYKGPDEVNFPLSGGTLFVSHITVR
jgi:hypothetical protein